MPAPVRRSGLQQEVINLYRQCFRAARLKPEANRPHFHAFIRMQFKKHSQVKQRDFSTIEYLLRMGKRQLETYSSPIRMTGEVIPHGANRNGFPVRSRYEERKKNMDGGSDASRWAAEFRASGKTRNETKESEIKPFRKDVSDKQKVQSQASVNLKAGMTGAYQELQTARVDLRAKRKLLTPREKELQRLRKVSYHWNKMERAAGSSQTTSRTPRGGSASQAANTAPTWDRPKAEDRTLNLDISALIHAADGNSKVIAFAGTDYGVRRMSETVPQTLKEISAHINRYTLLSDGQASSQTPSQSPSQAPPQGLSHAPPQSPSQAPPQGSSQGPSGPSQSPPQAPPSTLSDTAKAMKLPKAYRMTARQVNDVSHTRKLSRWRERLLRQPANANVRAALQAISSPDNSLTTAMTLRAVDSAHTARSGVRDVLQTFETSNSMLKRRHNHELRTKRSWAKLCAAERRYVERHALKAQLLGASSHSSS
ncbi:hypothetical protein BGZ65_007741 [Modicella reniformis]|uniref:Complex 1 LYR protein domain-containing protein n=1 Tax=Modicella reniformis TaxID=1440133 RepID=A0A9P6SUX8_9FUNG|nr:hypothetical protein BGZ65_007741 [Modicella reniformis]